MQQTKQVVREAKVKNATVILRIPKDEASDLKKEIRHRLDCISHNKTKGEIEYVQDDYDTEVQDRGDYLEVIVTGMDVTIHLSKYIPDHNVEAVVRWTLECSTSVIAVGGFKVKEHYTREI